MNNKMWLVVGVLVSLVLFSQLANAACRIGFYTIDDDENLLNSDLILGFCKNNQEVKIIKYQAGGLYSWGGPLDNCEEECGEVKINASIYDGGKLIMFGEQTLNSGNVERWNNESTKFFNLTLKYVDSDAKKAGSGGSRIVNPKVPNSASINPSGIQNEGGVNLNATEYWEDIENSKHLNNQDSSDEQSIFKNWMIYGIVGFVVIVGVLAFLFMKNKKMGGKI